MDTRSWTLTLDRRSCRTSRRSRRRVWQTRTTTEWHPSSPSRHNCNIKNINNNSSSNNNSRRIDKILQQVWADGVATVARKRIWIPHQGMILTRDQTCETNRLKKIKMTSVKTRMSSPTKSTLVINRSYGPRPLTKLSPFENYNQWQTYQKAVFKLLFVLF